MQPRDLVGANLNPKLAHPKNNVPRYIKLHAGGHVVELRIVVYIQYIYIFIYLHVQVSKF